MQNRITNKKYLTFARTLMIRMLQINCNSIFDGTIVTNLGGNMARFTQFPLMITRLTIIYEIISPGAAGSSIYV